jgi:hypothetical protein
MPERAGSTRAYGMAALAWAGLVVLQVFFAGLGIFGAESFETHRTFGNVLHPLTAVLLMGLHALRASRSPRAAV